MGTIREMSDELASLVAASTGKIAFVGGEGIHYRTALFYKADQLLVPSRGATAGEELRLRLFGDKEAIAKVQAFDSLSGIALLKLESEAGSPWECDTRKPKVGELTLNLAFASPEGHEAQLSMVRCVGSRTRLSGGAEVPWYFQTDGDAYPGFDGSAIIGLDGKLLGMLIQNRGSNSSYAIPAEYLMAIGERLGAKGSRGRAYLGIRTVAADKGGERGLLVTEIEADSSAAKAGLEVGDLILSIKGRAMIDPSELWALLSSGDESEWEIEILRASNKLKLSATPTVSSAETYRTWAGEGYWRGCWGR